MATHDETQEFFDQLTSSESVSARQELRDAVRAFRPVLRKFARVLKEEYELLDETDMVEDAAQLVKQWEPMRQKYKVIDKFLPRLRDSLRAIVDALDTLDQEAAPRIAAAKEAGYTVQE